MKFKYILFALIVFCSTANAQFIPGQILTAQELNNAFSGVLGLSGGTISGPLTVTGVFTAPNISLSGGAISSATITSSTINSSPIGAITPSTGAFSSISSVSPIAPSSGGTGSAFFTAAGPTIARTYTFPDAAATILYSGGALGTPSSGVATNLTGTASGLTAGNATTVITNANLTGPITSVGNATAIGAGQVTLANIATEATNTVIGNATSGSASPTALAIGTCSTSSSALIWTTNTGFGCNTAINASTLGGATFASPGSIGNTAAGTGAFSTLSASSTVSGSGFSAYLASPPAIGGTVAAAGAFTTLSASSTVSGTGFSTYLASPPSIGTTTAAAGKFTTLQATSTITPSTTSGIVGTTLADSANAGSIGEFPSPTNLTAVSLTTATAANVSSISLSPGDWDVQCTAVYTLGATTTATSFGVGISTTSATFGALGTYGNYVGTVPAGLGTQPSYISPIIRENISTTTTVYCVVNSVFAVSTMTANGYLRARRIR